MLNSAYHIMKIVCWRKISRIWKHLRVFSCTFYLGRNFYIWDCLNCKSFLANYGKEGNLWNFSSTDDSHYTIFAGAAYRCFFTTTLELAKVSQNYFSESILISNAHYGSNQYMWRYHVCKQHYVTANMLRIIYCIARSLEQLICTISWIVTFLRTISRKSKYPEKKANIQRRKQSHDLVI